MQPAQPDARDAAGRQRRHGRREAEHAAAGRQPRARVAEEHSLQPAACCDAQTDDPGIDQMEADQRLPASLLASCNTTIRQAGSIRV